MTNIDLVIQDLKELKKRVGMFIQPVTPEVLRAYFNGLERGNVLTQKTFTFDDFTSAKRNANVVRGWKDLAKSPFYEMREKGMTEDEIIHEMIELEIETWRLVEKSKRE